MLRNYGRYSAFATILAHIAYGAIVGGFTAVSRSGEAQSSIVSARARHRFTTAALNSAT